MNNRGLTVDQNSVTLKPGQHFAGQARSSAQKNNGGNEIERYRNALAKMEAQWEYATKLLNENVMHKQIEDLNV